MIEGPIDLERLDSGARATLYALTRDLLLDLLQPEWTRSPAVLDLANRYFPDLSWPEEKDTGVSARLATTLANAQVNVHEYFAWILLDFIRADASLQARLLERALNFSEAAGLLVVYQKIKSE
jgi:hypothetical protein